MTEVVLRLPRRTDEPALAVMFADPRTLVWNPGPDPLDVAAWIDDHAAPGTDARTWVVASVEDDRVLGTISLFAIDTKQAAAMIGYRTVPGERGRGVASAAVRAVAREAFEVIGLYRVQLFHAVDNRASCAVARGAGFTHEGTTRESYLYGDGRRHDEHLHARLRTDSGSSIGGGSGG